MTIEQTIEEIKKKHKPYTHALPIMSQQSYATMIKRIENGTAGKDAIYRFIARFGYKISIVINK